MNTLRTKYPDGLNNRARGENTNKLVALQFLLISRGAAKIARSITTVPTTNTPDATFEQIYLIIDGDIKNAYFHIHAITNTVRKNA